MELQKTDILVEWDAEQNAAIAFLHPDGTHQDTGVLRTPNQVPSVQPLVVAYPDHYDATFEALLGPPQFEVDPYSDAIVQTFPHADFSPESLRASVLRRIKHLAHDAFALTDWYLIRVLETGDPVPAEVALLRAQLRDAVATDELLLGNRRPSEYAEFEARNTTAVVQATREYLGLVPPTQTLQQGEPA